MDVLRPQVNLRVQKGVEVVVTMYDTSVSMGENRQRMIDDAQGEYVNFVDDDDLIPANYVARILPLLDGVDYIGFQVQTYIDVVKLAPTYHSLRYDRWWQDNKGAYRDISHLNPIRRELAIQVRHEGGYTHDQSWAGGMRSKGIVKSEHYVDEVMYFYYFRSNKGEDLRAVNR